MALTYQQAVEQTITGAEQFHEIINGSATSEVVVEDGSKIPTVRKALLDNFYYKDPINWQQGQNELVFNQIRKFTDGTWWIAPTATATNPVVMGVTPYGDPLWKVFSWDRAIDSQKANRKLIERSWAEAGYNVVAGSFQEGATLNTTTDVIINYGSDFGVYSWGGTLPKVVPANSTVAGTGGLSPTTWVDRTVASLYDLLKTTSGANIINSNNNRTVQQNQEIFAASDSPYTHSYQEMKIVAGGGVEYPGKMFVLSKGGGGNGVLIRVFNGNVAAPSLPSNSENGNWALWRTGIVNAIEYAWVYKKQTSSVGTWTESNVTYSAVDLYSDPMLVAFKQLKRQTSSSGGTGALLSYSTIVGIAGKIVVGFMCTATGPLSQKINVDGVTAVTINLRTANPSIKYVEVSCSPGVHIITIPHEEPSTNLNVIGINFTSINDLSYWRLDVDSWACYTKSPSYVTNEGAADYAFRAKNGANNWAGSYHGGEYERASPEFSLDHQLVAPSDSFVGIGRRFSILQQTQLQWTSTSESLDMDSLTVFTDAGVFMQCSASNVNLVAHTAYAGMNTASPAYDSAIGSKYFDNATVNGANYEMGPCQQVTQIERGTGRLIYTRFSRPPLLDNSFGGATVSFASGAYAKLYSGFVRNANIKLPNEFSFAFYRGFM